MLKCGNMNLIKVKKRGAKMSLFQRKAEEKRSIEEILTPKNSEENKSESADVKSDNEKCDTIGENNSKSVKNSLKEIQIETAEDISFNALTCFGWSESKTPKWIIKCAHFWYGFMSFLWFLLGAITFAPVIFIQKKIDVIFKNKTRSLLAAIVIYALMLAFIIFVIF